MSRTSFHCRQCCLAASGPNFISTIINEYDVPSRFIQLAGSLAKSRIYTNQRRAFSASSRLTLPGDLEKKNTSSPKHTGYYANAGTAREAPIAKKPLLVRPAKVNKSVDEVNADDTRPFLTVAEKESGEEVGTSQTRSKGYYNSISSYAAKKNGHDVVRSGNEKAPPEATAELTSQHTIKGAQDSSSAAEKEPSVRQGSSKGKVAERRNSGYYASAAVVPGSPIARKFAKCTQFCSKISAKEPPRPNIGSSTTGGFWQHFPYIRGKAKPFIVIGSAAFLTALLFYRTYKPAAGSQTNRRPDESTADATGDPGADMKMKPLSDGQIQSDGRAVSTKVTTFPQSASAAICQPLQANDNPCSSDDHFFPTLRVSPSCSEDGCGEEHFRSFYQRIAEKQGPVSRQSFYSSTAPTPDIPLLTTALVDPELQQKVWNAEELRWRIIHNPSAGDCEAFRRTIGAE